MNNTPQNVTTLQELLNRSDVNARLKTIFEMGNMDMAKMYLDNLLSDPNNKLAAKDTSFDMTFTTSAGVVTLSYSKNKITMSEKRKKQEKTSLEDRIKNGTAPIDEIERALADGSLNYKTFKEATENLDPNVSPYYKLLLTHENQVYLVKDSPAIKVTYSDGSVYADQEKEIEKVRREEAEAIKKEEGDVKPENIRTLLLGMKKPNSLEEQVIFNQQLLIILNQLHTIKDPEIIKSMIGINDELGIVLTERDGQLVVANKDDVVEDMEETIENHKISSEVIEESTEKLNDVIFDLRTELRLNDAGELSVKKEEIRLEVEERVQDGEDPDKILEDITKNVDKKIVDVTTKEPEMTTVHTTETVVPEPVVTEPTPTPVKTEEEIVEKTNKAVGIIESGQIPGPTMRKIIEEQFEGPNGQDPKKVAAREKMIKKLAEKGVFENYGKDLEGLQVGGVSFTKDGSTVQVEKGVTMAKRHDIPNAA